MITQELIHQTFAYDAEHPLALRWKTVPKKARKNLLGEIAGHWHPIHAKSPITHRYVNIAGRRRVPVSHIVWTIHNGSMPTGRLWFVDGNPGECRIQNLTDQKPSMDEGQLKVARRKYFSDWKKGMTSQEWAEFLRRRNLARDYGITVERYAAMLEDQRNVCAICMRPETMMRRGVIPPLSVDHCHVTEKVRGLLCANCNNGLGRFEDDPDRLRRAADYLAQHAQSFP